MLLTIFIISFLFNLVLIYITRNLLRKNVVLETVLVDAYNAIIKSYQNMKDADIHGAFEADDEVGSTFRFIQSTIEDLIQFLEIGEEDIKIQ